MSPFFDTKRKSDPYLRKLQRRRAATGLAIACAALLITVLAVWSIGIVTSSNSKNKVTQDSVLASWKKSDYTSVYSACETMLETRPLDPFYLVFKGFASFYIGLGETDVERRAIKMDEAVFSLRKALIDDKAPLKPETNYILGKAYFQKGQDYYPDAVEYLSKAIALGYAHSDSYEYLALATLGSGKPEESIQYFDKALELKPDSPELMLAAAQALMSIGTHDRAENFVVAALDATSDAFLSERCRFMLGEIYRKLKHYDKALACYAVIREQNPQSADAWYYEGLVLSDMGEAIQARAAWRKAIAIDPMHAGARQKLAER